MKTKSAIKLFGVMVLAAYLSAPACGNKSNNANPPPPVVGPGGIGNCIPGQLCNGVNGGVALLNGPTFSSLDYQGSTMILNFASGQSFTGGQAYNGSVQISGSVRLNMSCYGLPPGEYPVQGTGTWQSGYGGSIARVQAQLNMNAGQVVLSSVLIKYGQDNLVPDAPYGFYLQGPVYISACGGTFTAM